MAPVSHGSPATNMLMNFGEDDRLGVPQPCSREMQSRTLVGLWGEDPDDSWVHPLKSSFLFVVGTGGKLLPCSNLFAGLCEAWSKRFKNFKSLNLVIEATWNQWRCSWAFCLVHATAGKNAQDGDESLSGSQDVCAPWGSHCWQMGRELGLPCAREKFDGQPVLQDTGKSLDYFNQDLGCLADCTGEGAGQEYPKGSGISSPDPSFCEGAAHEADTCAPMRSHALDHRDGNGGEGAGRERPRGSEISSPDPLCPSDSVAWGNRTRQPRRSVQDPLEGKQGYLEGHRTRGPMKSDEDPQMDQDEPGELLPSPLPVGPFAFPVNSGGTALVGDHGGLHADLAATAHAGAGPDVCRDRTLQPRRHGQDPPKGKQGYLEGSRTREPTKSSEDPPKDQDGLLCRHLSLLRLPGFFGDRACHGHPSSGLGGCGGHSVEDLGMVGAAGASRCYGLQGELLAFGDGQPDDDVNDKSHCTLAAGWCPGLLGEVYTFDSGHPGIHGGGYEEDPAFHCDVGSPDDYHCEAGFEDRTECVSARGPALPQSRLSAKAKKRRKQKLQKAAKKKGGAGGSQGQAGTWKLVQRKPSQAEDFMLRPQDWSSQLISFGDLATTFEAADPKGCFEAVVHCKAAEISIAKRLLGASNREYSVLLVAVDLTKKELEKHELAKEAGVKQSIPGKIGSLIRFREGLAVQHATAGKGPPQPKGIKAPLKVEARETGVLFVKVPQAYCSADVWTGFLQRPKSAIASWAAGHHVQLTDSWQWAEEKLSNGTRQVFGILRAPTRDHPTLLGLAGHGGVFVFPPGSQKEKVTIEWIDRVTKESDRDYYARAMRAQSIGLAVSGTRLGWKKPIDENTRFSRIWNLNGCPKHWDMKQAADILDGYFHEVKLIRQHVRGSDKVFMFRGAAKPGPDSDLIPIAAQDGDDARLMLWAALAPPKQEQVRQKKLRGGAMPFVAATVDPFASVPVTRGRESDDNGDAQMGDATGSAGATLEAEGQGNDGTEDPKAEGNDTKRAKVSRRSIPTGCTLVTVPKDGNCLYHAFGEAYRCAKGQKTAINHWDLRARVADHLERHEEDYQPAWAADGSPGPDGKPVEDWKTFIQEITKPGKYSGETELRALCKLFSTRIVLIPADDRWAVCSYGKKKYQDLGAIFFADKHFDYLKPDSGKYPKEVASVDADPNGGFLVGGISEACSDSSGPSAAVPRARGVSQAATSVTSHSRRRGQLTKVAKTAPSSRGKGRGISVAKTATTVRKGPTQAELQALEDCIGAKPRRGQGRPKLCQWIQGGCARCRLCPFTYKTEDETIARHRMAAHFKSQHRGQTPSGVANYHAQMPSTVVEVSADQDLAWRCNFCSYGITSEQAAIACIERMARDKNLHKRTFHPRLSWKKWRGADYSARVMASSATRHKTLLRQHSKDHPELLKHFEFFRWPQFVGKQIAGKRANPIRYPPAWACKSCFAPCRTNALAKQHLKDKCSHGPRPSQVKALVRLRLQNLDKDKARLLASKVGGASRDKGLALFDVAKAILAKPGSPPLLDAWQISLVSVSEVDVNIDSRASWAKEWKRHGWHVQLSLPEQGVCRVALLSKIPLKAVKLCEADGLSRHAAAFIDLQVAGRTMSVLCVAVYLQSGQVATADAQARDILVSADYSGRPSLLFGDWNTAQEEGCIAETIQRGVCRACDEAARGEPLPLTGPKHNGASRRRRIDYGLTMRDFVAVKVLHVPEAEVGSLSDHRVVVYQFDGNAPSTLVTPPRRRAPLEDPCGADFSFTVAEERHFQDLLDKDLDQAWTFMSDYAEDLLYQPAAAGQVPRSADWAPRPPKRRKDTDHDLDQSPGLRTLRRLLRQLQLCVLRPWDRPLTKACQATCARARSFFPDLPRLQCGEEEAVRLVESRVAAVHKVERGLHLRRWQDRMNQDLRTVRSYVKRRADEQLAWEEDPEDISTASGGWHPAIAVKEQADDWLRQWQAPFAGNLNAIDNVLSEIPRPPAQDLHLVIEAEALMCATSVMRGKAGGADGWLPSDLLQLPIAWFRWAAALWNRILATGKVPAQWRKARVTLLWKKRRRTRPITLLCSLWRAGARVIQTQLGPWVASWADHTAAGGLPGTSVQAALMQIRKAMTDGAVAFIQSDIKSYFDSIHIGALQRALTHMRFPQPVLAVLTDFYNGAERIFSLSGSLNPSWSSVSSGIAQGCPLSPVIAALLSYLWSTFVIGNSSRSLGALAYIDDRTVWAKAGAPTDSLRDAMARSSAYDRAFGLRLSVDKCSVVAPTLGPELRALAAELEFQVMPDLEILGVRATFRGEWTLLKYHARKAILRARLLGWCTRNTDHQKFLLASLVVPPFAWASGFARCDRDDLTAIKADIENVFNHGFTAGFAKVCLYEAIGWNLQPDFACDLGALRVLWKASIQQPRWLDTVALSEARFRWRTMLPELPEVLRKLDWKVDFASTEVCRTDRSGRVRTLRPGIDGFCVVKDWLVQHFRQLYVARTGRVQRRLHRDDESLAVGLDLPAPGRHQDYYFDGLHTAISMGLRSVTLSALGAGSSCWHFNAGGNFDATHDRWRCLCGLRAPSRAHLLWNCEKTATLREGLQLPVDRCEERLLLRGAPEQPPPPPAVAPQECFDDLVEAIDTQLSLDPAVLFVATDGSEDKKVGAFAVAVHPGDFVCALGTADEDQSPFKQELLGFELAAKAVLKVAARSLWARRVVFVLDCQSALTLVLQKGDSFCYYLKIVDSIKASLRALRGHGVAVTCVWVPSHGKRPGWHAPPGLCGDLLRKLNASADEAAGACRLRRFSGGAIEAWWLHRNDARFWELRAIQASAASGEALHRELRRHGLRPRERAPDDGAVVPPLGSDFGGADPSLAAGGQSS
ncbi:unnamed protein product [Symbiodinium sp. CCMP2592]|nr:unnamed protein product [Symbiodinium sp. CCMP2592]